MAPVGFGCHRLEDTPEQRNALSGAIKLGCNLIDVAPGYSDGAAEHAVGAVLRGLLAGGELRRDEVVVVTKVGNVVGSALQHPSLQSGRGVARVRDDAWHCLEPHWIEEELTRSLQRLQLETVDCLLLHCPEFALKARDVSLEEVYQRIALACGYLETEVQRGRVARYGITAAFYPLRASEPEHLLLDRVIQFPLNFAEPQALWAGHTARKPNGAAVDPAQGLSAPPLLELARRRGLGTLTNRPLDGLFQELQGVLRFASEVPMHGEMQEEDVDAMEEKLTTLCAPALGGAEEPVVGELAAKTVKVLASLAGVGCVLVGMRRPHQVIGVVRLLRATPPLSEGLALDAVRAANNALSMWFASAGDEADHGTAKEWRLPVRGG